jgi:hypothetical protein
MSVIGLVLATALLSSPPVTLQDPGKPPLKSVHYAPRKGIGQPFSAVTDMRIQQDVAGQISESRQPTLTWTGKAGVTAATKGGGFSMRLTVEAVSAPRRARGVEPGAGRTANRLWGTVMPIRVEIDVDAKGRQERAQLKLPKGVKIPEGLREPLQGFYGLLRALHVPLPVEPIGTGATWLVVGSRTEAGTAIERRTVWTLKQRKGRRLTLAFETTESADEQLFESGGLPKGMDARLAGVSGVTRGELILDLGRPLPRQLTQEGTLEMRVEGRAGTKPFVLKTKATTKLSLNGTGKP